MTSAIKACQSNYKNERKYESLSAYAQYKCQEQVR